MREPLVLLPGLMSDVRVFGPVLEGLSRDRAITVAPITDGIRIEDIASGLLDVLPQRFALAGMGMGGNVAMEILRRAPDRVMRVALMNCMPLPETPQSAADYEPWIIKLKAGLWEDAVQGLLPAETLAPGAVRTTVMARMVDMAQTIGADGIISQIRALQRRRDYQAELRKSKVPMMVLGGAHDTLVPVKRLEFMADLIPFAELVIIPEAGHVPTLEQPTQVLNALNSWLEQPLVLRMRVG
ncbi:alpha/beta fold hydrolase [Roseovarius sp. EL26]|uniref:alpha/beta fold hydrolase n=1 Tax=Roseovarius sp. EL26 TaxID=2126672 RepID=UPI000EA2BD49|nr:alpha/beta hydrolase [Roseovarius sp. EL26]